MLNYKEEYRALCQQVITSLRAGNTKMAADYQMALDSIQDAEERELNEMATTLDPNRGEIEVNEPNYW